MTTSRRQSTTSKTATTRNTAKRSGRLPPPTASERSFEAALARVLSDGSATIESRKAPELTPHDANLDAFVEDAFVRQREFLRDQYSTIGDAATFHTKIVGVSFEGRQDAIAGLRTGVELTLIREPENEKDSNAIAVAYGSLRLGFLRAAIAKHIAPVIDSGARYRARVENITGGGGRHRGVNIFVERDAVATIDEEARERVALRSAWGGDAEAVRAALIGDADLHQAQHEVLKRLDGGRNVLALFGTGRGKSFCFQYPAVLRALAGGGKTLVIYPLRALANDQYEAMQLRLETIGLRILRANGSIGVQEREDLFAALQTGTWDVVLATPEFLAFHRDAFAGPSTPAFVVVDEAHHLQESRHRSAYETLGATISSLGKTQVLALTATAGEIAFRRIIEQLHIDAWVIDPTVRENLHLVDARGTREKLPYLRKIFEDGEKGIVYCNSRSEAGKVAEQLRKIVGNTVMFYHAGVPSAQRREVESYFRSGALRVVVATSAFGEGIDLPDVRHVVLYHLNFDFTEFNQQAGRAGRDGDAACVHLLFGDADRRINEFLIDVNAPPLPMLRELYRSIRGITRDGVVRMPYPEIARTLDLEKANADTIRAALSIFADEGLVEIAEDDEGRFVRFLPVAGRLDLRRNERFAEGEAERESFKKFSEIALGAKIEDLERLVNRPIYPNVDLLK